MNLEKEQEDSADRMILVNTPLINGLGRTNGCEHAYTRIISSLKEIYSSENYNPLLFTEENISLDNSDLDLSFKKISQKGKEFIGRDFCIFVGGDHSISYPLFKGFLEKNKNCGLIVLDAHADCMEDVSIPTHEGWLRAIISEGFPGKGVVLAGLRNVHEQEYSFLKKEGVNIFTCKQLFNNLDQECDSIMELASKFSKIYLTVDIDVLDSCVAPGTGYPEAAGLSSRELIYLLQRFQHLNIAAADIAEVNPDRDINNNTSRAAAKIIAELNKKEKN